MVVKVVATGMPWACRKVLYCMEAMKLMTTWEIWAGADSGTKPRASTATISMSMRMVSHRMEKRCLTGLGASSDTKAPST